ncbi:MAG: hypothetical protein KC618_04980, partial [Candidatus Omnitrophica bacterium]|nr:hypothetical protein [Candidatus Omnitrophota bacterium]
MRLRTSFFVFFVCIVIFCGRAEAQHFLYYEDLQKFKTNNPDGNKYEFVSDYIESLNYLRLSKT